MYTIPENLDMKSKKISNAVKIVQYFNQFEPFFHNPHF